MLLSRDKSQLLIIDVQEKLLPAMSAPERVVERCVRLVRAARALEIPITVSEQYPGGIGPTVAPLREALGNAGAVIEKIEFSCLKNDALRDHLHELRRKGRPQVVLGGIEAHVCVTQTAIDLEDQGFEAFVVADATSPRAQSQAAGWRSPACSGPELMSWTARWSCSNGSAKPARPNSRSCWLS